MSGEDCLWCDGYADGYRVGPNGLDPDGTPTTGYDETKFLDAQYRAGLSVGRADRIDHHLMGLTPTDQGVGMGWPPV